MQAGDRGRQRIRGLTLRADDPEAMAKRWAQVFDQPAPSRHGDGWRLVERQTPRETVQLALDGPFDLPKAAINRLRPRPVN